MSAGSLGQTVSVADPEPLTVAERRELELMADGDDLLAEIATAWLEVEADPEVV